MDAVIPWSTLRALVEPYDTKAGRGRRPIPVETMPRMYFLQQWFVLSDSQAENMLHRIDEVSIKTGLAFDLWRADRRGNVNFKWRSRDPNNRSEHGPSLTA